MAFNKISLKTIENQTVSIFNIPLLTRAEAEKQDIIYHLGTSLRQTTYNNPANTSIFTLNSSETLETGFGGQSSIAALHNRNSSDYIETTNPSIITWSFLQGYELDINAYTFTIVNTTNYITSWRIEGSNDNTNWTVLHTVDNFSTSGSSVGDIIVYRCPNRFGFFTYIRYIGVSANNRYRLGDIFFYGRLRNLITGNAGSVTYTGTFNSFQETDIVAETSENRVIKYDGNTWETVPKFPYKVVKLNLTADHSISSAYESTFYIVSPGGANRTITLPSSPEKDDAVKFKNVDGSYDLIIEEVPGDPTPVVMNNAGKTQYEFIYDGVEWIVSG